MEHEENVAHERVYVSDVVLMDTIERGRLNLIYAPCGSGKTYFIENTLRDYKENPNEDMLYLAPTRSLRDAFEQRGNRYETTDRRGNPAFIWKQEGITAMTYAAFGKMIQDARDAGRYKEGMYWNNHSLICLDELSQAVRQEQYDRGERTRYTKIALDEIEARIRNKSNLVLTVSATPKLAVDRYWKSNSAFLPHLVKLSADPKGYATEHEEGYYELDNLLKSLDPSERGLVFASQIKTLEKGVAQLKGRGISAECIFSDANSTRALTKRQREIVRILTEEERIPEDIQVLFINSAYETGLNIRPEKSHLDYIVVHTSNEDTQTQVRGRYRGDLDKIYLRQKLESVKRSIPHDAMTPYLGIRLGKSEKNEIRDILNFRDEKGRLRGWKYVAGLLRKEGYAVDDGNSGDKRYTVIEAPADE